MQIVEDNKRKISFVESNLLHVHVNRGLCNTKLLMFGKYSQNTALIGFHIRNTFLQSVYLSIENIL